MKLSSLKAKHILIKPLADNNSEFISEHRKYERNSMAEVIKSGVYDGELKEVIKEGSTIIYDDSHSVDFMLDSEKLSIIKEEDWLATITEE